MSVDRVKQTGPGGSSPGNAPVARKSSFGGTTEKCYICQKAVYKTERVGVDDKVFHENCFKCQKCSKRLELGTYASVDGQYYCKPHYQELFRLKGNYTEGFGPTNQSSPLATAHSVRLSNSSSQGGRNSVTVTSPTKTAPTTSTTTAPVTPTPATTTVGSATATVGAAPSTTKAAPSTTQQDSTTPVKNQISPRTSRSVPATPATTTIKPTTTPTTPAPTSKSTPAPNTSAPVTKPAPGPTPSTSVPTTKPAPTTKTPAPTTKPTPTQNTSVPSPNHMEIDSVQIQPVNAQIEALRGEWSEKVFTCVMKGVPQSVITETENSYKIRIQELEDSLAKLSL